MCKFQCQLRKNGIKGRCDVYVKSTTTSHLGVAVSLPLRLWKGLRLLLVVHAVLYHREDFWVRCGALHERVQGLEMNERLTE